MFLTITLYNNLTNIFEIALNLQAQILFLKSLELKFLAILKHGKFIH